MTSFATLGLDPDEIRTDLQALGIDDSVYSDEELASLMLVTSVALEQAISDKAGDVEELMYDYTYQTNRLLGMQGTFDRLLGTMAVENATSSALIDFLQGEDAYLDLDDTSVISLDYSWSRTRGADTYTLETFDSLQDFVSAVANNETVDYDDGSGSATVLNFGYQEGLSDGLFGGVVDGEGNTAAWSDFVGGGDYYIRIKGSTITANSGSISTYMDLDGLKQYLIALALQEADYIGDDVRLDPVLFASTSLANSAFTSSENLAKWLQLYYGQTKVAFDADAATLSLTYSGAAALREMGLALQDYFDDADPELDDAFEILLKQFNYDYTFQTFIEDYLPAPMSEELPNWMLALTASFVYGDLDSIAELGLSSPSGANFFNSDEWSDISDFELTEVRVDSSDFFNAYYSYVNAETLDDLLEDAGTAIQSQSSTGQLALVEASTAITEWSELHNGWDTVHKYVTDALGRALALIK